MRRICIATWELGGFTAGGIGVLVRNLLVRYGGYSGTAVHLLWYGPSSVTRSVVRAVFPDVEFHDVDSLLGQEPLGRFPPPEAYRTNFHYTSVKLMRALKQLELAGTRFDLVEFPDFAGAALATLEERALGRAFASTVIAVRLHSTERVLRPFDHRPASLANSFTYDLERKALRDADIIVSHLRPITASVRKAFGFDEDWVRRVRTELPPVYIAGRGAPRAAVSNTTPIVFASKVQWVKRPDLFVNGVVDFLNNVPQYRGSIFMLAHVANNELKQHCEGLIPKSLKDRIEFTQASNEAREDIISRSVCVIPSSYESFCLAAYEASMLGAVVVLNGTSPAFGSDTPWIDGVNCIKFDGTAAGLGALLKQMFLDLPGPMQLSTVACDPPATPYWELTGPRKPARASPVKPPPVSAIVLSRDSGPLLSATVSSLLGAGCPNLRIQIVDACSEEPLSRAAVDNFASLSTHNEAGHVHVLRLPYRASQSEAANAGLARTETEFTVVVEAGTILASDFLSESLRALAASADYDFVSPQVATGVAEEDIMDGRLSFRSVTIAEAPAAGLSENVCGSLPLVGRTSAFRELMFDETLDRFTDWDFYLRATLAGHKFIVTNHAAAYRLPSFSEASPAYFRGHADGLLSKHFVQLGKVTLSLTVAFDRDATAPAPSPAAVQVNPELPISFQVAGRDLTYYLWHTMAWWRVAYRQPFRIRRWLTLREVQRQKGGRAK
jgi:hypothetical protein